MIRSYSKQRGRPAVSVAKPRVDGTSIPAPVGGWNTRDSLADMRDHFATILDNWFPRTSDVKVRSGYSSHATGLGASVDSLMAWNGPASSKMFGAAASNVYEVTGAGAVGAASISAMTSDRWQHTMFGTDAGNYLYIVNGSDAPRYYDGSTWTVPTITGSGLTASNLIHVAVFKRRLLFCESGKLGFWYFPVVTIAGAITYFNLAPLFNKGGYLMAIGNWTRDGGSGPDDFCAFITSEGEVAVFQGTDPGDATAWELVGVYTIGQPIGRRCLTKLGGELIVVTTSGFVPLSMAITSGDSKKNVALSDRISASVNEMVVNHRTKFGWQPIVYPNGNMLIFNIPTLEGSKAYQFVQNTTTGAWCRFTNQNANCWEIMDHNIYFGGNSGVVYKADTGLSDADANITTDAQTAFSYLKRRGQFKKFNLARPLLATDASVYVAMEAVIDFENRIPTATPTFVAPEGSPWDTSPWDTSPWSDVETIQKDWQTINGGGYAVALRLRTTSNGAIIRWLSNDILYEPGGPI